jgi:hypothetical protein
MAAATAGPEDSIGSSPGVHGLPRPTARACTLGGAHPGGASIDLDALVRPILVPLAAVLAAATVLLAIVALLQARRLSSLDRRLDGITRGSDGRSLEATLASSLQRADEVGHEVDQLAARSAVIEADLRNALQRVGLVRFNPFEETGGNQSFALALLDAQGNGFVISSLHARSGTRIYGKALVAGRAETALSAEESEAVRIALTPSRRGPG